MRVEFLHQRDRAAAGQRREEADERRVGIERRRQHRRRRAVVAEGIGALHMRPAHAMRLHDALGHAGRAGGIDDVERVGRIDRRRRCGFAPSGASQSAKCIPTSEPSSAMRTVFASPAFFRLSAVDASRNRSRAPQSATMPSSCSGVDDGASGDGDDSDRQRAEKQRRVFDRGRGADGDRRALRHAVALQGGADAIHQLDRLAIGLADAIENESGVIRQVARRQCARGRRRDRIPCRGPPHYSSSSFLQDVLSGGHCAALAGDVR